MKPLLGHIVRLTKSIQLQPGDPTRQPHSQFFAGRRAGAGVFGGLGVTWWYDDDTFRARDAVAALTIASSPDFRGCDIESASEVVMATLQEICVDRSIFDSDAVLFSRRETLFDGRAAEVEVYACAISKAIENNLRRAIGRRCTLYAVPRFQVPSFELSVGAVRVINKNDEKAWQSLIDVGYVFGGWSPTHPQVGARDDRTFAPSQRYDCVLAAEDVGTQAGTRFNSILKFRKMLAVLFAIASERAAHPYHKSMASPPEFCVQFPHASNPSASIARVDCEPLVPFYASDIPVGVDEIHAARDWYARCTLCRQDAQSRIEKGAHFLNRGMNADDIDAYINYFVTLDALFGERGSVETSILAGVRAVVVDAKLVEKTRWLFELRSEIVHGGSRYIAEWPRHSNYVRHFRSKPEADVRVIAQRAVLRAPHVFS